MGPNKSRNLVFLFVFAYLIRIIYPKLFMTGGDLPGHIMASMRLSLTSPFSRDLIHNSFAQLLQFNHGYTVMLLPFFLYSIFFSFFSVNEVTLVFVNSLIGILGLTAIYYFTSTVFNRKLAILSTLLIAVCPIHIGLSRAHVGTQMIQSIFFFLGLAFMHNYFTTNKIKYLYFYALSVLFLIGSDNLFFVALFMHFLYSLFMHTENLGQRISKTFKFYFNPLILLSIIVPIAIYGIVTYLSITKGITSGYILRLFSKGSTLSIQPFKTVYYSLVLIGPIVLTSLILFFKRSIFKSNRNKFLVSMLLIYFVILSISSIEMNYIFFLIVPITLLTLQAIFDLKYSNMIYWTIFVLTFFYSFFAVYTGYLHNFGSVHTNELNNDFGVKALGYLVRSGEINISKIDSSRHGFNIEELDLYTNYEGAYYYLGYLWNEDIESKPSFIFYVNHSPYTNETISNFIETNGYKLNAKIGESYLYGKNEQEYTDYNQNELNEKFDANYGTIKKILNNNIALGHY